MTSRERPSSRGRLRGERLLAELLREIRDARLARNLSQGAVGNAVGLSDSRISVLERGGYPDVPFVVVAQLLATVGLELSARSYPAGAGLRDAAQVKLLHRLRLRVSEEFSFAAEVPMPIPGDLRAWDAALVAESLRIGVDAETRIRDVQAVDRRVMLKLRDSAFDRAVILVAATRTNRLALRDAAASLAANYAVPSSVALRALETGRDPGGNSVIVL
jgi:transcriptional regulator with XRE-family HTH domain